MPNEYFHMFNVHTTNFDQAGLALGSSNGSSLPRCHCCNSPLLWVAFKKNICMGSFLKYIFMGSFLTSVCWPESDCVLAPMFDVPKLSAYFHQISFLYCLEHGSGTMCS